MTIRLQPRLVAAVGLLSLAACGGGGSGTEGTVDSGPGGNANGLQILSCSLGCSSSQAGSISCAVNQVFVNQELAVEFNQPVKASSLNPLSFRVVSDTGSSPSGEYAIDPSNPRRAIFRPLVTFGSDGLPQFGLSATQSYTVQIPAFTPGAIGFFVESVSGLKNVTALSCAVLPTLGVNDTVPGAPVVTAVIEQLNSLGQVIGSTNAFTSPVDVQPNSRLKFTFNDVMNPATLVNTVTKTSDFIEVLVDIDGVLSDPSDQLPVPGSFDIDIVQTLSVKSTTVIFTPDSGFPTAGSDPVDPRRIVVVLPPTITDLGNNSLANAGEFAFTTIPSPLLATTFELDFDQGADSTATIVNRVDSVRTSMLLSPSTGRVVRGLGGGSGQLGDLDLVSGDEVTLSTGPIPTVFGSQLTTGPVDADGDPLDPDDADFETELAAYHVRTLIVEDGLYPADWATNGLPGDGPGEGTVSISNGVFQFSSLRVDPGARIVLVGENPARIFVRGNAQIRGAIRGDGESSSNNHIASGEFVDNTDTNPNTPQMPGPDSTDDFNGNGIFDGFGGFGGRGGPGAGAGGEGADRAHVPGVASLNDPIGPFPWGANANTAPATGLSMVGSAGEGRSGQAPDGGDDFGAGQPGGQNPVSYPGPGIPDLNGFLPNNLCQSIQVGAPGSGATFSSPGAAPMFSVPPSLVGLGVPPPPPLPMPSTSVLRASDLTTLDPAIGGELIGGAGGGGGGSGIAFTKSTGKIFACSQPNPALGPTLQLLEFADASGAGGGGGGGAVQLQVGNRLQVLGSVVLRGGDGGGLVNFAELAKGTAAPGGGGSGGSLLAQAFDMDLGGFPGVVDVTGGAGGQNILTASKGGAGSPGIVHLENSGAYAGIFGPDVAVDQVLVAAVESQKIEPLFTQSANLVVSDVLALDNWVPNPTGPGATYGFQTCWLVPEGNVFGVTYLGDSTDPETMELIPGWDLEFELTSLAGLVVPLRALSPQLSGLLGGQSLEQFFGSELGSDTCGCTPSPFVVRFQGARFLSEIEDPCNVFLSGDGSPVLPGSVTPWLASPEEVTAYWENFSMISDPPLSSGVISQRESNMIRAQVIIDSDLIPPGFIDPVLGLPVTRLFVRALTD